MLIKRVKLNFLGTYCMFYDWLSSDNIQEFKNIKVYRVDSQTLDDFIRYKITILNNSLCYQDKPIIFSDSFSYVGIIFDQNGHSLLKSSLSLEDEFDISKQIDEIKLSKIEYIKSDCEEYNNDLRMNCEIKETILKELDNIAQEKNIEKITYYYYEWFKDTMKDEDKMLKKMYDQINHITDKEVYISNLMKKCNKVV